MKIKVVGHLEIRLITRVSIPIGEVGMESYFFKWQYCPTYIIIMKNLMIIIIIVITFIKMIITILFIIIIIIVLIIMLLWMLIIILTIVIIIRVNFILSPYYIDILQFNL